MGSEGSRAAVSPDRRVPATPRAVRGILRNGLLGLAAVGVVVATHFGFPVSVMLLSVGLTISLVGIVLFLVILLSVAIVPIGVTIFLLEELENRFCDGRDFTIKTWPWVFAIPSVAGVISLLFAPNWIGKVPDNYILDHSIVSVNSEISSWLIAGVVVITVFVEFGSRAVFDLDSSSKKESTANSQSDRFQTPDAVFKEFPNSVNHIDREFLKSEEYGFNWQEPPLLGLESVGGFDDVKDELYRRVIHPLKSNKESYHRFRVSPPTGILLYGPPGTGKTYLARAIAGELGAPYVELSQADLTSKWVNESPSKVRRLFEESEVFDFSVIFIDEIDGLIRSRGSDAHNEDSKVVSEFLARLADDNPNFLIIAATNRPDQLDSAVLRPGRFDEQFEIGLPNDRERIEIFKVQLRGRNPSLSEFEYREIGARSEGFTAAEITSIVDRAALRAAQRDAESITLDDLLSSLP